MSDDASVPPPPQMDEEVSSKSDLPPPIEIDPEFNCIERDPEVSVFMEAMQTIQITETCAISPRLMFYITVLLFCLPGVWAIVSVLLNEFPPEKMFFDSCYSNINVGRKYSLLECIYCCDNRSYILTSLVPTPPPVKDAQTVSIIVSSVVTALAIPVYARLTIFENMAIQLLSYGVVVKSAFNVFQIFPALFFTGLFVMVAVLNMRASVVLGDSLHGIPLGRTDTCNAASPFGPNEVLYAWFYKGNPSFGAASVPQSNIDFAKLFLVIFLPYVGVIQKLWVAALSTFSKLGLEDLIKDNKNASDTFAQLKYQCDEDDLLVAINEYAATLGPEDCSAGGIFRRLFVFSCSWDPPTAFFLTYWGDNEKAVRSVLTILKSRGEVAPYQMDEDAAKAQEKALCNPLGDEAAAAVDPTANETSAVDGV